MTLTVDEILERARRMLDVPTLYWIGMGGQVPADDAISPPGQPFDLPRAVEQLPESKRRAYLAKAQAAGIDPLRLPPLKACDCSGFVWWVLRQPRADRNTDWIWRDARGTRSQFEPCEPGDPLRARPGAIVVFPRPPSGYRDAQGERVDYGHIGIVTEVDAAGYPACVIHCAAENYLAPPTAGAGGRPRERNGIAETGPERFFAHAAITGFETQVVWHTGVPR